MVDVSLSALPSAGMLQTAQPGNAVMSVSSQDLGPLASLPIGSLISGFVLNRDANGNPVLRTASGDFLLKTPYFLKIGSDVVVRVSASGTQFRTALVSVDGLPPQEAETISAHATNADSVMESQSSLIPSAGAEAAPETSAPVTASTQNSGTILQGRLLTPTPADAAATLPRLPAGALVSLRLVAATYPQEVAPTGAALPAAQETLPATAAPQPTAAEPPAAAQPAPQNAAAAQAAVTVSTVPPSAHAAPAAEVAAPGEVPQTQPSQTVTAQAAPDSAAPGSAAPQQVTQTLTASTSPPSAAAAPAPAQSPARAPSSAPPAAAEPILSPAYAAYARAGATVGTSPPASSSPPPPLQAITQQNGTTTLQAQVLALTAEGEPVLQTPLGLVQVNGAQPLPAGSQLTLALLSSTPPEALLAPGTTEQLAAAWPALQQLISTLETLAPGDAQHFTQALEPSPSSDPAAETPNAPFLSASSFLMPQAAGGGLAGFIAALSTGDIRNLLGPRVTRMLQETGHSDLLQKADTEFANARQAFFNAPPQQWQALLVPLWADGEMRPLRIFVKRERDEKRGKSTREPTDTRFVVETEFSQLGPLQLDGFLKKRESTQFDLIVRTAQPLPADARSDILAIYDSAGQAAGFKGMLMFQETPEFPVRPLEDIMAEHHRVVTA